MLFYSKGITGYVGVTDVVTIMIQLMNCNISGERFALVSENLSFESILLTIAKKMQVKKPSIELKPWMTAVVWRLDWLVSFVFKTKRNLSKYSANSLHSTEVISNEKIKNPEISGFKYEFQSIDMVLDVLLSNSKNQ